MRKYYLFLLTIFIFGTGLCSLIPKNTEERGVANTDVPLIDNNLNTQVATEDYLSLLPLELWCHIMGFVDFQSGEDTSLSCKLFYQAWKMSNLKRVQKWMINGMASGNRSGCIQRHFFFDMENANLEIGLSIVLDGNSIYLNQMMKMLLLRIRKLSLPYSIFLSYASDGLKGLQFPEVKELSFIVTIVDTPINFQLIRSIFPNVNLLQLDLRVESPEIPVTTQDLFSALPKLEKLVIRVNSKFSFSTRNELVSIMDILKDSRVEVRFDSLTILLNNATAWPNEIFDSELKSEEMEFKMKNRAFFSIFYDDQIQKTICENERQIHSLFINDKNKSLDSIFSIIGKLTQLELLYLSLNNVAAGTFDPATYTSNPFSKISTLHLQCSTSQSQKLLSSLHVVFPNLDTVDIITEIEFDSWFESILQLKYLEIFKSDRAKASRKALIRLLDAVAKGTFPNLRELDLPLLKNDEEYSDISDQELVAVCRELAFNYPLIKIYYAPHCCSHFF